MVVLSLNGEKSLERELKFELNFAAFLLEFERGVEFERRLGPFFP